MKKFTVQVLYTINSDRRVYKTLYNLEADNAIAALAFVLKDQRINDTDIVSIVIV